MRPPVFPRTDFETGGPDGAGAAPGAPLRLSALGVSRDGRSGAAWPECFPGPFGGAEGCALLLVDSLPAFIAVRPSCGSGARNQGGAPSAVEPGARRRRPAAALSLDRNPRPCPLRPPRRPTCKVGSGVLYPRERRAGYPPGGDVSCYSRCKTKTGEVRSRRSGLPEASYTGRMFPRTRAAGCCARRRQAA